MAKVGGWAEWWIGSSEGPSFDDRIGDHSLNEATSDFLGGVSGEGDATSGDCGVNVDAEGARGDQDSGGLGIGDTRQRSHLDAVITRGVPGAVLEQWIDEHVGETSSGFSVEGGSEVDHIRDAKFIGNGDAELVSGSLQGLRPRVSGDCRDRQPERGRHCLDLRRPTRSLRLG